MGTSGAPVAERNHPRQYVPFSWDAMPNGVTIRDVEPDLIIHVNPLFWTHYVDNVRRAGRAATSWLTGSAPWPARRRSGKVSVPVLSADQSSSHTRKGWERAPV